MWAFQRWLSFPGKPREWVAAPLRKKNDTSDLNSLRFHGLLYIANARFNKVKNEITLLNVKISLAGSVSKRFLSIWAYIHLISL